MRPPDEVAAGIERELELARYLVDRGYNILVFDFRGHGQSGGNFISYGIRERFDVLAAISWIRANHQPESQRLFPVGQQRRKHTSASPGTFDRVRFANVRESANALLRPETPNRRHCRADRASYRCKRQTQRAKNLSRDLRTAVNGPDRKDRESTLARRRRLSRS